MLRMVSTNAEANRLAMKFFDNRDTPMNTPRMVLKTMPIAATRNVFTIPTHKARLMVSRRSGESMVWIPSPSWKLAGPLNQL